MTSTLQETEKSRQEMMRMAFIDALAQNPDFEFETALILNTETNRFECEDLVDQYLEKVNLAWGVWQIAHEQMLQATHQKKGIKNA